MIYTYWMATWREGTKTRNVHLGSCTQMGEEGALQKARAMKAITLAMRRRKIGGGREKGG